MKKTQFQVLIKKKLQVHEVKIRVQGCLIDILIKKKYFNQSMYLHKQMTNMSKIITSITNDSQGRSYHGSQNTSNCLQEPHKSPIVQKIDLWWEDSLTIRWFYTMLRRSYRFKFSTIINSGIKNKETILQARARDKSSISML